MRKLIARLLVLAVAGTGLSLFAACRHFGPAAGEYADGEEMAGECLDGDCPKACCVKSCDDPTVMALAHDLDHLERHIDWHGSVVAKVPDVWGQARLTQYREEFEKEMAFELNRFQFGINGSIARSDQAFFASATALSFAVQPRPPVVGRVTSDKNAVPALVPTAQTVQQVATDQRAGTVTTTNTTLGLPPTPTPPPAPTTVKPLDVADPKDLLVNADKAITQNPARLPTALGFQGGPITIEPAEYLAQKKRYLDFLNQLRRENEGDDTADSPGYSLNLMRVPVSVLPGKKTDVGYGCEITMTLTPILGQDLLPVTFRNLVTNDLIDHLGFPLTNFLDLQDVQDDKVLTLQVRRGLQGLDLLESLEHMTPLQRADFLARLDRMPAEDRRRLCEAIRLSDPPECWTPPHKALLADPKCPEQRELQECQNVIVEFVLTRLSPPIGAAPALQGTAPSGQLPAATPQGSGSSPPRDLRMAGLTNVQRMLAPKTGPGANTRTGAGTSPTGRPTLRTVQTPSVPFSNGLLARQPFPTSLLLEVYGIGNSFEIAYGAYTAFKDEIAATKYVHLPNVQMYLREELNAAYQFLNAHPELWKFCDGHLAEAVKGRQSALLDDLRTQYRRTVGVIAGDQLTREAKPHLELVQYSKTAALSWCILVEAALLTDRLQQDMKELATSKQVPLPLAGQWLPYYLPDPPPDARQAFADYVKARWPIHVFALDPYLQEQNIADSLSTRREMQLALAIAFTNGMINARQLTRYTRRLEAEYETIDLNRTQVGFSHGENTFGWRFYPRYQTPDTKSNLEVLGRELLVGGPTRNQLLRDRRLEPGMRECVAIVMMPSFVPYLHLDTVSNWFPLPNPKHKVLDTAQAMRLSRTVQAVKTCGPRVADARCYRDGEFDRLLRRAEQLEARLPTQTLTVQVPQLNTLGGFEMFNHGVADLAPELFGFYGAPGISPDKPTTLFLVGDHFSPLRTRVIVGNLEIVSDPDPARNMQRMLSRQVMQVTVPANALAVKYDDGTSYARIHVATPYGVSTEIEVPILSKPDPKPGFAFGTSKLTVRYGMQSVAAAPSGSPTLFVPTFKGSGTDDLKLTWNSPAGTLGQLVRIELEFDFQPAGAAKPVTLRVPCHGAILGCVTAKEIVLPQHSKDQIAADLVTQLAALGPYPMNPNPLDKGLKSKAARVIPVTPAGVLAQAATTTDALAVAFSSEGVCGPAGWCPLPSPAAALAAPLVGSAPAVVCCPSPPACLPPFPPRCAVTGGMGGLFWRLCPPPTTQPCPPGCPPVCIPLIPPLGHGSQPPFPPGMSMPLGPPQPPPALPPLPSVPRGSPRPAG